MKKTIYKGSKVEVIDVPETKEVKKPSGNKPATKSGAGSDKND